jgi:SulP family sulfate permease
VPNFDQFSQQYINSIIIALLVFLVSATNTLKYSEEHGYDVDMNQEMLAHGLSNVVGSFFCGFVSCGAMSRSTVANAAGAKTLMYGIVTGLVVTIILLVATPVLYYVPSTCLSGMILVAAYGLWDFMVVIDLWKVRKIDCLVWFVAFFCTLFLSASTGLLLALGFSLLMVIYRVSSPHIAVLGRLPRTTVWRNVLRFPDAIVTEGLLVLRIDADMFFGNIRFIHKAITQLVTKEPTQVHVLLLDFSAVSDVDFSAVVELRKTVKWLKARDIILLVTAINGQIRDVLKRSRFMDLVGEQNVFWLHSDAAKRAKEIVRAREPQRQSKPKLRPSEAIRMSEFGGPNTSFSFQEQPKQEVSFIHRLI